MKDRTFELAMVSLQGPRSKEILSSVLDSNDLPEPMRNALNIVSATNAITSTAAETAMNELAPDRTPFFATYSVMGTVFTRSLGKWYPQCAGKYSRQRR